MQGSHASLKPGKVCEFVKTCSRPGIILELQSVFLEILEFLDFVLEILEFQGIILEMVINLGNNRLDQKLFESLKNCVVQYMAVKMGMKFSQIKNMTPEFCRIIMEKSLNYL